MAKNIIDLIPTGKHRAISRSGLLNMCKVYGIAQSDRKMRRLIEDARKTTVILNIQDGSGYFRPAKDDIADLKHYIAQEHERSISILHNLTMANNLLEDMEVGRV